MNGSLAAAFNVLPDYLSQHVLLSAAALVCGIALSFPLIILAIRNSRWRWWIITSASLVQTIPSLALLALFYPLLLALSALTHRTLGYSFSALGFLPSLLALTLYSMLPIIRNTVTAVVSLDPDIIEAAQGVGMTRAQMLWRVQLPLAMPMLMAGIRTAAVWVIGGATLATPVGQTTLGNYIFSGLQIEDWVSVLFGCVVAALLALLVDQLLALIERGIARRSRWRVVTGAALLLLGLTLALSPRFRAGETHYVLGAKNFSEQYILAALMKQRIVAEGGDATERVDLGSVVAFRALANNELDAYVDYSGTVWANVISRTDVVPRDEMLRQMHTWLKQERKVELLGPLGFANAYVFAMRKDRAAALGVKTLDDLARVASQLKIGSDFEFFSRPEWMAFDAAYGLNFAKRIQFQSTFMYKAVESGEVDVITAFSSDGRIAADDLLVLDDTRQVTLPYDAIILLSPHAAGDARLHRALAPLVNAIPIERMRAANLSVDASVNKLTPAQAAVKLSAGISVSSEQ
jgi:osmoprotectant transport system permease protein